MKNSSVAEAEKEINRCDWNVGGALQLRNMMAQGSRGDRMGEWGRLRKRKRNS